MHTAATAAAPAEAADPTPDPGRHLVLIVDDYQDCREMYAAYLSLSGFEVLKARDGAEAVATARQFHPDIILMDLSLPGVDGVEATRRLKAEADTRSLPVIALTAQSVPSVEALTRLGFDGVITKPCLPDELVDRVNAVVHGRTSS